jgi:prophage regulatory protein
MRRFLRLSEVRSRVPFSKGSIYRLVAAKRFPAPYSLGARASGWLEGEIDEWIASRIKARAANQNPAPGAQAPEKTRRARALRAQVQ